MAPAVADRPRTARRTHSWFDCNGTVGQQWRVRSNGWVMGVGSGKRLDAYDNGTAAGTQLILWPRGPGTNQKWIRA